MDYDLGQGMDYGWCVGQNQDQDGDQDMEDIDENQDAVKNMNLSWNRMWVVQDMDRARHQDMEKDGRQADYIMDWNNIQDMDQIFHQDMDQGMD